MSALQKLRVLVLNGDAQVEDILACVRLPSSVADDLEAIGTLPQASLSTQLRPWITIVALYLRSGADGLRARLSDGADYVLAVVEELGGDEGVHTLAGFLQDDPTLGCRRTFWSAINSITSFSNSTVGDEMSRLRLRQEAHRIVQDEAAEHLARVDAVYALRGIGDATSLPILMATKRFAPPYENARDLAIKAVRKRTGVKS